MTALFAVLALLAAGKPMMVHKEAAPGAVNLPRTEVNLVKGPVGAGTQYLDLDAVQDLPRIFFLADQPHLLLSSSALGPAFFEAFATNGGAVLYAFRGTTATQLPRLLAAVAQEMGQLAVTASKFGDSRFVLSIYGSPSHREDPHHTGEPGGGTPIGHTSSETLVPQKHVDKQTAAWIGCVLQQQPQRICGVRKQKKSR